MTLNKFLLHQILTAPLIILVCLFSADLEAGVSVHSADGHGDYIKIYVGPPKNPFGLDWKSLVPDKYAEISPGPIPQNYLAEFNEKKDNKYSLVEYSFVRSVPRSITNKYYYLITKSGIHEIAINNLEVTVRFDLYRDKPSISYVSYWGLLVSRKNDNSANGFVLSSPIKLRFKVAKIKLDAGTKIEDRTQSDPIEITSPNEQVAVSYRIFVEQSKELFDFVLLNYDGSAICSERMFLIQNKDYPKVKESYHYGCDV